VPFSLSEFLHIERKPPEHTRWVRSLAALSIGNLFCIRAWDAILHDRHEGYLALAALRTTDYFATVSSVGLISVCVYALVTVMWYSTVRWQRAAAMSCMLVLLAVPLDFLRGILGWNMGKNAEPIELVGLGAIFVLPAVLAVVFRQWFFSILLWLMALISPYAAFNLATAATQAVAAYNPDRSATLLEPSTVSKSDARVLWVVFDEWDHSVLFEHRPKDVALTNLDALLKESVLMTAAIPPSGRTMTSIPALLTGQLLADAKSVGASELLLRPVGSETWTQFRMTDNIITRTLQSGMRAAVFGWYHPYGRLFLGHPNLSAEGFGFSTFRPDENGNLASSVAEQLMYITSPAHRRQTTIEICSEIHAAVQKAISSDRNHLIFAHYSVPHTPGIYSPKEGRLSSRVVPEDEGYIANLALVDKLLGDLLKSGARENTTLILTSDHWWRKAPWAIQRPTYKVPLIIRSGRGGSPLVVDTPFCTNALAEMVTEVLNGRIRTNAQIAEWLRTPRGIVPKYFEKGAPVLR
jgi:hypothetical protein